jgi:hypothetical protein
MMSNGLIQGEKSVEEGIKSSTENTRIIAMSYASMQQLQMRTAEQVLAVFRHSERIWHDMHLALNDHQDDGALDEKRFDENLVIRSWIHFEPDMEFRCFVLNGRLVAVSQYRHLVYFPRLKANQDRILATIHEGVVKNVMPKLEGLFDKNDYVLDVGVEWCNVAGNTGIEGSLNRSVNILSEKIIPETHFLPKVLVIEINPYYETTDGCLFSWYKDPVLLDDSHQAQNLSRDEQGKPEFRFNVAPRKGASALLYGAWRDVVKGAC